MEEREGGREGGEKERGGGEGRERERRERGEERNTFQLGSKNIRSILSQLVRDIIQYNL